MNTIEEDCTPVTFQPIPTLFGRHAMTQVEECNRASLAAPLPHIP